MTKHPLHTAFENWKLTEEGRGCLDAKTLDIPDRQIYLANRIYRAFYAGAQSWNHLSGNHEKLKIAVMRVLAYRDRLPNLTRTESGEQIGPS